MARRISRAATRRMGAVIAAVGTLTGAAIAKVRLDQPAAPKALDQVAAFDKSFNLQKVMQKLDKLDKVVNKVNQKVNKVNKNLTKLKVSYDLTAAKVDTQGTEQQQFQTQLAQTVSQVDKTVVSGHVTSGLSGPSSPQKVLDIPGLLQVDATSNNGQPAFVVKSAVPSGLLTLSGTLINTTPAGRPTSGPQIVPLEAQLAPNEQTDPIDNTPGHGTDQFETTFQAVSPSGSPVATVTLSGVPGTNDVTFAGQAVVSTP